MKVSSKAIELLSSYNDHALTAIAPSSRPNELDGLCVIAVQEIKKGTKLFDAPTDYNLDNEVALSSDDIKTYVHNIPALMFIKTRCIPMEKKGRGRAKPVLVFSIPGGGPNSVTPSYYIGHARDADDTRANVTFDDDSEETDFCGLPHCIASRDIGINDELVFHYNEESAEMYGRGQTFINDCIADQNGLASAKNNDVLGDDNLLDGAKKNVIGNLNSTLVMLKPSKVHKDGIGVFVSPGANQIIRDKLAQGHPFVELFMITEGSTIHSTEDLPFEVIMDKVTSIVGLAKIGQHFLPSAFLSTDGGVDEDDDEIIPEIIPLHGGGPNALDPSHYCNSCVGTGHDCNASLLPFDSKKDSFSRIVVTTAPKDDEEILLEYEFLSDEDVGNDGELNFDESNNAATGNADHNGSVSVSQGSNTEQKSQKGDVLNMYENVLLDGGKFESASANPPSREREKFKVPCPEHSDVATSDDIEERHRIRRRYCGYLCRTHEERYQARTGAPCLTNFEGSSYEEKIMLRSIHVAVRNIGTRCPGVLEGMFKVYNVEGGTVQCQLCLRVIKITRLNKGSGNDVISVSSRSMQHHTASCNTDFALDYICGCGFGRNSIPSLFTSEQYLVQHWKACKKWPTLFDRLIVYKNDHPDKTSVPPNDLLYQFINGNLWKSPNLTQSVELWTPRINTVLYMSSNELDQIDTTQPIQYIDGLIASGFHGELDVQWSCYSCKVMNDAKRSKCSACQKWKGGRMSPRMS